MPIHFSRSTRARLFSVLTLFGVLVAHAQRTPETENQEVIALDRFVVTGSHLDAAKGASPVMVLTSADIGRSGVSSNVLEILRKQMPALVGSGNIGMSNGSTGATSTYGGSKLALHNMPTLVLLNGRRVATNGANARGGSSFVDVSQFPVSAIERIEVVADGASAVYGSDAIGGVVNVILKPSFSGSEVGGGYAFSNRDGDYSEKSAYVTTGATNGRLGVIVNGSYFKSTPLMQTDRPFSSVAASSSYSGVVGSNYLNPTLNSPSQAVPVGTAATATSIAGINTLAPGTYLTPVPGLNLAGAVTLLTEQERRSGYTGLTYKIIDRALEAFGDLLYSKSNSYSQLGAQSVTFSGTGTNPQQIAANTPYNPTTTSLSPSLRYTPAPRRYSNDARLLRFTTGLRGEINPTWRWEAAYTYNTNKLTTQISNVLYTPNLDLAVLGGYDQSGNVLPGGRYSRVYTNFSAPAVPSGPNYDTTAKAAAWLAAQRTNANTVLQPALDPFARPAGIDPASLANVLGTSHAEFTSGLQSLDLVVRGGMFDLPAGAIDVAIGGDHRLESLKGLPDDNSRSSGAIAQRWSGATLFDVFDQDRAVNSGFIEVRLPVTSPKWNIDLAHAFDASFAYRVEHYSDMGRASSPHYGLRWQPLDGEVTVRYSYSKAFAAPTLFQMAGTQQALTSDLRNLFGLPAGPWQATSRQTPNSSLAPMLANTQSIGIVIEPRAVKGLTVTLDYSDSDQKNLVGRIGANAILQSVNQLGAASPYASQVAFYNFPGKENAQAVAAPGDVKTFLQAHAAASTAANLYVVDPAVNLAAAKVRALDVSARYVWPTRSVGTFEVGTTGTFIIDDKIQVLPGDPFYEYAGLMTSAEGTMSGSHFYTTLGWQKSGWDVSLGNTYFSPGDDMGTGGSTASKRIRIPSYVSWDLSVGYTVNFQPGRVAALFKGLRVTVGVNNLADKMPPSAPQAFPTTSAAGADVATYGAIGRLCYVNASLKF